MSTQSWVLAALIIGIFCGAMWMRKPDVERPKNGEPGTVEIIDVSEDNGYICTADGREFCHGDRVGCMMLAAQIYNGVTSTGEGIKCEKVKK